MKKNKWVLKFFVFLALICFTVSCKHPAGAGAGDDDTDKSSDNMTVEQRMLGTWAYDYGYNQDEFSNEELTFNADKTFIVKYGEGEFERGTYKIVNDKVHGLSIEWHFTEYGDKNGKKSSDVTSLYKCTFDDDDTVHLDRFSRDRTKMGGMFETFDPPRENTYHRIKDGTKETLTSGKWRVNKIGTPNCNWDEEWTFNVDGTMKDVWTDSGAAPETCDGTYEVIEKDGKNVLHHILDWGTSQPEWWYEYKTLGPNLITVQLIESTNDGKVNNADINYYYREVETEKFTYHFANYTLDQTVPKASSYTLTSHPYQLNDYPPVYAGYEIDFLGWYDNPECTGSKLTEAVGNKREYWAKTGVRIKAKEERDNGAYYYGKNVFTVKAFSDMKEISAKKGDTITVYFEATVSKDYDARMGLDLTDYTGASDFWTNCWHNVKSNNKKIQTTFTFNIDKDIHYENMDDIGFIFAINSSTKNDEILFTDIKFVFLDNTNSYKITYNFGDVSFETKSFSNTDFELAKSESNFSHLDWRIDNFELLGWYDNPELTGTPVTSISAGNTADKTYYAKFNLRIRGKNMSDDGKNYNYPIDVPLKSVLSGASFNPKPGDTISIYFEATFKNDLDGWASVGIVDATNGGWRSIAGDGRDIKTTNKKMKEVFSMTINSNETLPTDINNYGFNFCYNPDACDDTNIISDWKIVLLDETNSYNITYHYGNFSKTVKGFGVEEYNLPITTNELNSIINWRMAEQEFLGWYDNPSFTGNAVTSIAAGNKTAKEFWMKYNLKTCRRDWDDNGTPNHLWDSEIPLTAVIPDFVVSELKQNTTIKIKVTATPSVSSFNKYFLRLVDLTSTDGINEGWKDIAWTEESEVLADNKISHIFNLNVHTDASTSELKDILFGIGYGKETYDQSITLSDWKFEVVD